MDPFAITSLSRMTFANIPMQLLQCSARTPVHSGTNLSGAACEPKSTRVRPFHPLGEGFAASFVGRLCISGACTCSLRRRHKRPDSRSRIPSRLLLGMFPTNLSLLHSLLLSVCPSLWGGSFQPPSSIYRSDIPKGREEGKKGGRTDGRMDGWMDGLL